MEYTVKGRFYGDRLWRGKTTLGAIPEAYRDEAAAYAAERGWTPPEEG